MSRNEGLVSIEAGQKLLHYRLDEKIGEGGMGVVWKAMDTRLDRTVALKLLPTELETDSEKARQLAREARAVAALNHPNIVTIHAIEEHGGRQFLVMELARGVTLDEILTDSGMPLTQLLDLAIAMTDAVSAAHECGVAHRDLKPGNIMVDGENRLKILDFGLAKTPLPPVVGETSEAPTQSISSDGRFEGTIPYMSPEQIRAETVDRHSDLFSLGVILYEMATGRKPFVGNTAAELIASILRDEPVPVVETRPDLPRQLGRIIRHALEKDSTRRFQTALDMRNELEELREEVERGEVPNLLVRSLAVLPLDDLSGDPEQAWFADGMTDALISSLARISALKVISRSSVMQYKGVRKPLPETANELGVDAVVEGSVLRAGNRVRITAQLIDAMRDRLLWGDSYEHDLGDVLALQSRVARAIAERIEIELTPQEDAHLAQTRKIDPDVHEACLKGRHFWYKRTNESVTRGLECFERAADIDPSYAPAYAGIADSYIVDGGRYLGVSPEVAYAKARAAAARAVELDESLAEAHTSLAAVMTDYDWDWEGADREYRRAIELNPNYVTAHSWYAEQLSRMGRHDEAVSEARLARQLDPLSLVSSMIVAWILYFARRYDEAARQALHTLELDPAYATALRILGWTYEELGRFDDAIAAHTKASDLAERQPNFAGQLGRAYALSGNEHAAREVLGELVKLSERVYVSSLDIAIIQAALGDKDAALDWLERAFAERADHLPYIKVNPRLDGLRAEPRFRKIMKQMGLLDD
jgi:serine/threonine protein kinase/tetratricopeptide (TPR) repeat protein